MVWSFKIRHQMCSVRQLKRQWETKCLPLQGLLLPLLLLGLSHAWPIASLDPINDECYEEYALASANASYTYTESFVLCELRANETKIDLTIDIEMERFQIQEGASSVCNNLANCEALDDHMDYFQCIKENGNRNLDFLQEINYNATSAHTRLRDDYDEVQKTFVMCTLEAQEVYVRDIRQAYEDLQLCRG